MHKLFLLFHPQLVNVCFIDYVLVRRVRFTLLMPPAPLLFVSYCDVSLFYDCSCLAFGTKSQRPICSALACNWPACEEKCLLK